MSNQDLFATVREQRPLVHCITNYVTAGDVANMILAAGASPVMADGRREAEEITRLSRALVLNIGTLQEAAVESMLAAGKLAAGLGHPVVFDPVGAGASTFRTETALRIVREIPCTVIRGNASEIRTIARGMAADSGNPSAVRPVSSHGVDADEREKITKENRQRTAETLKELSRKTGAVIVMTGETDLVADGKQACMIKNGHPMMARITGTGCMMDGVIAAALAVSDPEERFENVVYAAAAYGLCGELAWERMEQMERAERTERTRRPAETDGGSGRCSGEAIGGTGSFRMYFFDAMSRLEDRQVQKGARYEA